MCPIITLVDTSAVNSDVEIQSQWQAHFLQIFPFNMENLPSIHPSDKSVFKKYWSGPPINYSQAMKQYYSNFNKKER